jgi:ADP-ribosylglycohydrolase
MAALTLALDTYRDKVLGGWQGKSAGITLGAPLRGQLTPGRNNYYSPVPGQPAASSALDFPLVWLHTLESTGPDILPEDLAVAWLEHLDYSQDEFGYAALNLRRGLPPPASGAHSNWFRHGTGSLMRADLWGMLAPGAPQTAATYAYHDAKIDHCEDGIWAAMCLAAMGSAAFFLSDPLTLLTVGLVMMPRTCRTARAMKTALAAGQRAAGWLEARESVQHEVGNPNFTDVAQNMGFFTIGLLYGQTDFGGSLCAAVNCGYDAEVVGGALGSILGIMRGSSRLPEAWTQPIGDLVIPGLGIRDMEAPTTLTELTELTVAQGRRIVSARCPHVEMVDPSAPTPAAEPFAPTSAPSFASFLETSSQPEATPAPLAPDFVLPAAITTSDAPPPLEAPPALEAPPSFEELAAMNAADAPSGVTAQGENRPVVIAEPPPLDFAPAAGTDAPLPFQPSVQDAPVTMPEYPNTQTPESPSPVPGIFTPQPVSATPPQPLALVRPDGTPLVPPGLSDAPVAPDPVDAIAWADNTLIKPLLVTPPAALVGQAGPFEVVMDTHDSPTLAYNQAKSLSFTVYNRGTDAFNGRILLLAPPGWQIGGPPNLGQRQFLAANTGILRADFILRAPEGQARIEIANAVTLRFLPEGGGPPHEAEFVLLGASCWWTVGPFANFDGEGFDRSYLPEDRPSLHETYRSRSMQTIRWEKHAFPESTLDLEPLFSGSSGVCYGQTILRSPVAREARLVANTNSGVKMWLNGALVLRRYNRETFRPLLGSGPWAADVTLRAGDNAVMVKWVRGTEPFAFSLTVSDRYGRGLPEIGNMSWG